MFKEFSLRWLVVDSCLIWKKRKFSRNGHSLLLVFIRCFLVYHSFSLVVICYTTLCHSLSFVVTRCSTRCHSLSLFVIGCHSLYQSLSLDVPLVCLFINDPSNIVTKRALKTTFKSLKPLIDESKKKTLVCLIFDCETSKQLEHKKIEIL